MSPEKWVFKPGRTSRRAMTWPMGAACARRRCAEEGSASALCSRRRQRARRVRPSRPSSRLDAMMRPDWFFACFTQRDAARARGARAEPRAWSRARRGARARRARGTARVEPHSAADRWGLVVRPSRARLKWARDFGARFCSERARRVRASLKSEWANRHEAPFP
jgi:hypothetical protein